MQTGDRLGYHPERAVEEIAHLKKILPQAQAAVATIDAGFVARMDARFAREKARTDVPVPIDFAAESTRRLAAIKRAVAQVNAAGK